MATRLHLVITAVALGAGSLLSGPGLADDSKDPFQNFLPVEVYRELTRREVDLLQELLKDAPGEQSLRRARVGAVLVAALAMCVKEGSGTGDLRGIRAAALRLVDVLSKKDQLTTARNLVERLRDPKNDPEIKAEATDWGGLIKAPVLMIQFLPKAEGGDGLHPDLQSDDQPRGAKNGILEKIRYLTRHELTATAMQSEAQELELFGYRTAVIGSLTYRLVPTKMKAGKTPQEWRDLAVGMRDQSLALARSARERNPAALRSASVRLRAACSKCHNAF